ncbi:hypothetical protein [Thermomonospora cellulosilytica]|uniref:Uncharacterized protein n=1 Tax=Thermomonospora cellulosilytica TaxID=1411118 RepID=A0A7W3R7L4_9ACTN|nr:hypothetical protein [Thermomonospora cellulosilytica]MBA9002761.1 hypothetical protein [Thermomonospora cellulosilytica]
MSEYQYYEFCAVDRPLGERERSELRVLSTRARITATSFVNEYHWGDFRGDPRAMMERYFDAFLYLADWGTRQLMFRVPRDLIDLTVAERYCHTDAASVWTSGDDVIVSLYSDQDPDDYWEEPEGRLASIVPVRAELAAGDLRLLYLGWLLAVQADEIDDDELEPLVPPNLRMLSAPLRAVADFLRIDRDLLSVAARASVGGTSGMPERDELAEWVKGLPHTDKDRLLAQVASGEGTRVQRILQRRFRAERPHDEGAAEAGARTAGELWKAAGELTAARERAEAERLEREWARQEAKAAAAHEKRLDDLAGRQEDAWRQVDELIATTRPRDYDRAVAVLTDLRALARRQDRGEDFAGRLRALRERHQRKPSLLRRFDQAGL